MFSYKTVLNLENLSIQSTPTLFQGYELSDFSFGFDQGTDHKGQPSTRVIGGRFSFSIPYLPPKEIVEWSINARKYKDGTFSVYDIEGMTLDRIIFKNATCTSLNIMFNNSGSSFGNTSLVVYAEDVTFLNGILFSNDWTFN